MAIELANNTKWNSETRILFQEGDKKAFGQMYEQFAPLLFGVILRIVEERKDAEKVLTTVFIKIWNNRKLYCPEKGSLTVWLLNFAREAAFSFNGNRMVPDTFDFDWKKDDGDCTQKLWDMMFIYGKSIEEICLLIDIPKDVLIAKLNKIFKISHSRI